MKAQETAKIKITIGTTSFVVTTYNNETALAFLALLPLTVSMNELNGNEKYYYMSDNLPSSPEQPSTIHTGDLMLYQQNYIVIFYETFSPSYSYTRIGYMDNPTGLKTALGSGNPTVTFEVMECTTAIDDLKQNSIEYKITNNGLLQYTGNAKKISLIDMNGRVLSSTTSKVLNVISFPSGIYILKVEGQNQMKAIKIKI